MLTRALVFSGGHEEVTDYEHYLSAGPHVMNNDERVETGPKKK